LKSLGTFDDSVPPGIVTAGGTLSLLVRVPNDQYWEVNQVSARMATVPSGAELELRKQGQYFAHGFSARKAEFSGEPPLTVRGGESFSLEWTGATPGEIGTMFYQYVKYVYA
jgi:hypothetical protein